MKQFFLKKEITAILFIVSLIGFAIVNCVYAFPFLNETLKNGKSFQEIETLVNENLYQKKTFIESYGLIQESLDKKEFNNFEVIKGHDDMLYLSSLQFQERKTTQIIERMNKLQKVVKKQNGQLITLLPPDKYIEGKSSPLSGYPYSYNNETANQYINGLKKIGVPVLDYREYFQKTSLPIEDIFYKTDHHWKIQSAFQATQELIDFLNQKDSLNLDSDHFYYDINNYNQMTYKNCYIGSLGRKTGQIYSQAEDFTLIYPKFETNFTYDMDYYGNKTHKEGRMEDALINLYYFSSYQNDSNGQYDLYNSYLDYNCSYAKIVNKNNPNGLKVAFYKDSFSMPLITFFSHVCSEIDIIDPRFYDGDIDEYFQKNTFDYVFVSISPDLISEEAFLFFKEE
ncbi:MAG: alginate O-acetyltransferase AlgX-related protein [Longibaculum sp.]